MWPCCPPPVWEGILPPGLEGGADINMTLASCRASSSCKREGWITKKNQAPVLCVVTLWYYDLRMANATATTAAATENIANNTTPQGLASTSRLIVGPPAAAPHHRHHHLDHHHPPPPRPRRPWADQLPPPCPPLAQPPPVTLLWLPPYRARWAAGLSILDSTLPIRELLTWLVGF